MFVKPGYVPLPLQMQLKFSLWALLSPELSSFFPLRHMDPVCCHQAKCQIHWPIIKLPKFCHNTSLKARYYSARSYYFLPHHSLQMVGQKRTQFVFQILSSRGPSWLSAASLGLHQYSVGKPVVGDNHWTIPGWDISSIFRACRCTWRKLIAVCDILGTG